MARLALSLLGPFQVKLDGRAVTEFESNKVRALLAYLAAEADQPHSRDELMGLLWLDQPDAQARNNLRHSLTVLRQAIGDAQANPAFLTIARDSIQFNTESDYWVDVTAFASLLAACKQHAHRRAETCQSCAQRLAQAVEHYRGDFLEQLFADSAGLEEWALVKREGLRHRALEAMYRLAEYHERRGEHELAHGYTARQLELDPWCEEAHRQAMRALALLGQRSAALEQYEKCRHLLADELNAEPDRETMRLYEKIRSGDLVRENRRHNLPAHLSKFIGREQEIEQLKRRLDEQRLITLTGSGGIGKTRLAIQVGHAMLPLYPHGVWLVELAPLARPELVVGAVATVLGVRDSQERPVLDALTDYLREKTALLVLDNCEHLIDACAQLAAYLLQHCSEVQILASSREALGIEGEMAVRVPSLSLPPAERAPRETLEQSEAVRLFVERAAAVLPDFEMTDANAPAIVQVCRRLDGVALAIELAAARVKLLKVEHIAARLDDAFRLLTGGSRTALPRQQTLRATIEWSHNLLSESERTLLRRLSVFAGGWTLEAAEAVCAGDGLDVRDILDLVTQLVNKSLVMVASEQGETARYRLLETTRQYAREKLAESGEGEDVRGRHLDYYYLELAERIEPQLRTAERPAYLRQATTDLDNVRAALEWSFAEVRTTEVEKGLRLASALEEIWDDNGRTRVEGVGWLQQGLALLAIENKSESALVRAKALRVAGHSSVEDGMHKKGRVMLEESVALYRAANHADKRDLVLALTQLAYAWLVNDPETARTFTEESVALGRALEPSERRHFARALFFDGWTAMRQGDYAVARSRGQEALALFRQFGDSQMVAATIRVLGWTAEHQGDLVAARSLYQEALCWYQLIGSKLGVMMVTADVAVLDYATGNYESARARFEETLSYFRDTGGRFDLGFSVRGLGSTMLRLNDTRQAARLLRESLLMSQEMQTDRFASMSLAAWGEVLRVRREWGRAAVLLGAVESQANQPGNWVPTRRADYDETLAATRAALGEEAFVAAMAEGRAMTLEQAIAYALADDVDPQPESFWD